MCQCGSETTLLYFSSYKCSSVVLLHEQCSVDEWFDRARIFVPVRNFSVAYFPNNQLRRWHDESTSKDTRAPETLNHDAPAPQWPIPDCPEGGRRSSRHSWICRCIGMQPFSNSCEFSTRSRSSTNFVTISQTVQDLSHWEKQTHTSRLYWKQYHLRYAIAAQVVKWSRSGYRGGSKNVGTPYTFLQPLNLADSRFG